MRKRNDKFLQPILQLAPEERSQLRLCKKRGPYNTTRPKRSRDELIQWACNKNIRTVTQLKKISQGDDPVVADYIKEFGKWSIFVSIAYCIKLPSKLLVGPPPTDAEYIVKTITTFDIQNQKQYNIARRKSPDVFPTLHAVRRQFGSWKNAIFIANRYSAKRKLEQYQKLSIKYGKHPTRTECTREKLDITDLINHFGSKPKLDEFLDQLEKAHENGTRSS